MRRADLTPSVVAAPLSGPAPGESVRTTTHPTTREADLSVETPTPRASRDRASAIPADAGGGWLTFAGILLLIDGVLNFIGGIAAIDDSNFFVGNAKFQFGDLNTWGWVIPTPGSWQALTPAGSFPRIGFAPAVGWAFPALAPIPPLWMLPAYPLWSLALFTMDILIIYGLVSYSSEDY